MELGILGPLVVTRAGTVLDLGSPLQRALLALLVLDAGRVVSEDGLVEALWEPGGAPTAPAASLQTYVARLRRILEPERPAGQPPTVLRRVGNGYRLDVPPEAVDATRFERLASAARRHLATGAAADALTRADRALALWRSDVPLPELGDRSVTTALRARWVEQRVTCTEDRCAALVALGRAADAVADLESLTTAHPLRERPWLLLMTALHDVGRTADALERYQRVRTLLDDELGLQPGPQLRALQTAILRGDRLPGPPGSPTRAPGEREPEASAGIQPADPDGASRTEPGGADAARIPSLPGRTIGRQRERTALAAAIAELDTPRFVLLEGEPGIGKTRLAADLARDAAAAGTRVAWGRCHEDDTTPPLWPWRQVLAHLPGPPLDLAADDEGLFGVFEDVRRRLAEAASTPLLVVVDDVHWADAASLRLLAFLAVELADASVAVVLTARPGVASPLLARVRADLARTPGYLAVTVPPLAPPDTRELVRDVLGDAPVEESDVARVHARSGGNPFFAAELARLLASGAGPAGAGADEPHLPHAVLDVVDRRLGQLPAPAVAVLRLGAVVGDRFDLALLLRASSLGPDAAAEALDAALTSGMLRAEGEGYAFTHALVREALLAQTTDVQRRRLHATIAAAQPTGHLDLAHHLVHGRPFTSAATTVAACLVAARSAEDERTYEAAVQWWERALAVRDAEPSVGHARHTLLLGLGTAQARAGLSLSAQETLGATIDGALAAGDVDSAATAAAVLGTTGGTWFWVRYGTYPLDLLGPVERTLVALGEHDSPPRIRVLSTLATGCVYGDAARARQLAAQALAMARRLGDPDLVAETLAATLFGMWLPEQDAEVVDLATELLALAESRDAPAFALVALMRRAVSRFALGDIADADADLDRAGDLAAAQRLPLLEVQYLQLRTARTALAGDLTGALALADQVQTLLGHVQAHLRDLTHAVTRMIIAIERGGIGDYLPVLEGPGWEHPRGEESLVAHAHLDAGDVAAARRTMAERDGFGEFPRWWNWLAVTCYQAELAHLLDDPAAGAAAADRLRPYSGRLTSYGGIGLLGPVDRYLGQAEAVAGRLADAEQHLRRAVEISSRHGFRGSLATAELALAEVLLATGREAQAEPLLADALRLAREAGMAPLLARARAQAAADTDADTDADGLAQDRGH